MLLSVHLHLDSVSVTSLMVHSFQSIFEIYFLWQLPSFLNKIVAVVVAVVVVVIVAAVAGILFWFWVRTWIWFQLGTLTGSTTTIQLQVSRLHHIKELDLTLGLVVRWLLLGHLVWPLLELRNIFQYQYPKIGYSKPTRQANLSLSKFVK